MKLEKWFKSYNPLPYTPPEACPPVLCGHVYGHPVFEDGEPITTSVISHSDEDGNIHTKSGSIYELGESEPGYETLHPGAKERVIEAFKEKADE